MLSRESPSVIVKTHCSRLVAGSGSGGRVGTVSVRPVSATTMPTPTSVVDGGEVELGGVVARAAVEWTRSPASMIRSLPGPPCAAAIGLSTIRSSPSPPSTVSPPSIRSLPGPESTVSTEVGIDPVMNRATGHRVGSGVVDVDLDVGQGGEHPICHVAQVDGVSCRRCHRLEMSGDRRRRRAVGEERGLPLTAAWPARQDMLMLSPSPSLLTNTVSVPFGRRCDDGDTRERWPAREPSRQRARRSRCDQGFSGSSPQARYADAIRM